MHLSPFLAYIDPGSGSLMLQMIIAGVVGAIAFFRHAIFSFFGLFKGSKNKPAEPVAAPDETERKEP